MLKPDCGLEQFTTLIPNQHVISYWSLESMEEIDTESKLGSHSSHFSIGLGFPLGDFFKRTDWNQPQH